MKRLWDANYKLLFYAFSAVSFIGILGGACSQPDARHKNGLPPAKKRLVEAPVVSDSKGLVLASNLFKDIDPEGNIFLYVSNQSFVITPVDITAEIDGKVIVDEMFKVGNQHRWKRFRFKLSMGKHEITASSKNGNATLHKTFTVKGKQWAVLDYWYYPETNYNACPKHLTFEIFNEQIYFQ